MPVLKLCAPFTTWLTMTKVKDRTLVMVTVTSTVTVAHTVKEKIAIERGVGKLVVGHLDARKGVKVKLSLSQVLVQVLGGSKEMWDRMDRGNSEKIITVTKSIRRG